MRHILTSGPAYGNMRTAAGTSLKQHSEKKKGFNDVRDHQHQNHHHLESRDDSREKVVVAAAWDIIMMSHDNSLGTIRLTAMSLIIICWIKWPLRSGSSSLFSSHHLVPSLFFYSGLSTSPGLFSIQHKRERRKLISWTDDRPSFISLSHTQLWKGDDCRWWEEHSILF